MQIKTNYQLCDYINSFIDQTVSAEDISGTRNQYFAMYVFLLHKVFNVKIDFCKELVSIYARAEAKHGGDASLSGDIYLESIDAIVAFNNSFEHALKKHAEGEDVQLMLALSAVSSKLLKATKQGATKERKENLLEQITVYIEDIANIFSNMPMQHDTLEAFAKKHSVKLD